MARGQQSFKSRWQQTFRDEALRTGIKAGAQNTLRLMADYANVDGTSITVSQQTLAAKQGISVRSVRSHQRDGERTGWIVCQHRGTGPGDPSIHRLNIATLTPAVSDPSSTNGTTEVSDPRDSAELRKSQTATAEVSRRNCGSDVPTTMDTMSDHGRPPEGVGPTGEAKRLIRASDLPPMTPLEHALIARAIELGMEV